MTMARRLLEGGAEPEETLLQVAPAHPGLARRPRDVPLAAANQDGEEARLQAGHQRLPGLRQRLAGEDRQRGLLPLSLLRPGPSRLGPQLLRQEVDVEQRPASQDAGALDQVGDLAYVPRVVLGYEDTLGAGGPARCLLRPPPVPAQEVVEEEGDVAAALA